MMGDKRIAEGVTPRAALAMDAEGDPGSGHPGKAHGHAQVVSCAQGARWESP